MAAVSSMVLIKKIETGMVDVEDSEAVGVLGERRSHAIRTLPMTATSTSRHCAALPELKCS